MRGLVIFEPGCHAIRVSEAAELFDYNYWANERITAATAKISAADFVRSSGLSYGGVRGTLTHLIAAERGWLTRFKAGSNPEKPLSEEQFPDLKSLLACWQPVEASMRSYLKGLTDRDLDSVLEYRSLSGKQFKGVLWKLLVHVVNHGTQHRAEAADRLTALGASPGDIDYVVYQRTKTP